MKLNKLAPCTPRVTASVFALAGCLTLSVRAVEPLYGDYEILPGNGEPGSLSVTKDLFVWGDTALDGNAEVGGALGVMGSIDFGIATSNAGLPGLTMQYLGSAQHDAAFDLTDSLGSFLWRDNAGATPRPKMKLGTDNILSLYNSAGSTATITLQGGTGQLHLAGTGSGVYANGTSVFTVGSTGSITWDRAMGITNTTASTSSTTGALTVAGGIGVGLDSYIHGLRIGQGNGNISSNTVVGAESLIANTTGFNNATLGFQALNANTTGRQNIAVGYQTLKLNTTGNNNTATGFWSMMNTTTPNGNSAYGAVSLRYNTTGSFNSAVGNGAVTDNQTGSANTGLGAFALRYNTTGSNNVALGYNAGANQGPGVATLTSPENSIYIGTAARGFSDADDNSIVIGYNALGEGANTTVIGNSSTVSTHLYGQTNANSLKVNGASDLNNQVVVEPAVAPDTAVRAMKVLANGTILIKPGGNLSMGDFTAGDQP